MARVKSPAYLVSAFLGRLSNSLHYFTRKLVNDVTWPFHVQLYNIIQLCNAMDAIYSSKDFSRLFIGWNVYLCSQAHCRMVTTDCMHRRMS